MAVQHSSPSSSKTFTEHHPLAFRLVVTIMILWFFIGYPLLQHSNLWKNITVMIGFGVMWLLSLVILATNWHQRNDLGLTELSKGDLLLAVIWGFLLSISVPLLSIVGTVIMGDTTGIETIEYPRWVVVISVATAGITEEIIFRGYLLTELEHYGKWTASMTSGAFFIIIHLLSWPLVHILFVVFPFTVILTMLFLRTRNLYVVILVHLVTDLPLILM